MRCIVILVMIDVGIVDVRNVDKFPICLLCVSCKKRLLKQTMNLNMKIRHKKDINSGCVLLKIVGR